jgi:Bacterial Ig-like domain (group 3)
MSSATTDTYQVAYSLNFLVPTAIPPVSPVDILGNQLAAATLQRSLNPGGQLSWTNRWTSSKNNATLQTQALSIVNPLSSDNYTGPSEIQVWKDNLYGTFMFYPRPNDTAWILTSTQSSISAGSSVTLTATVTPDLTVPYTPTGTVKFYDGCTLLGAASVNPATGTASILTNQIVTAGANVIQAVYSGDTNFFHNDAPSITITVN